ncbi:MAG: Ppx/GppA phosphatase family protein [Hyphomicrobiales bacterium]
MDATNAKQGAGTSQGRQHAVKHGEGLRATCSAAPEQPFARAPCEAGAAPLKNSHENKRPQKKRRRRGRRGRRKSNHQGPAYGALDLGTNNCRLLVACPSQSGFRVIDAFSRIVRLGEGVSKTGRLSPDAMDRCISALRVCASKLKWRGVKRSRLIATEACRVTENGGEFIERVMRETGLELEIIDRETEANLAFAGSAPLIAEDCENVLVFDIGGGSTELMWVRCSENAQELLAWASLPAGVVTVAEGYGGIEVTPDSYGRMKAHAFQLLDEFAARVAHQAGSNAMPDHLLGTSGTVTTIAGVHLGLRRYDRSKVDGCWMNINDVTHVTDNLLKMSFDERAASPCIGRERADLVLAGCAIFDAIKERWPAPRIRVADRGLREGILTKLMKEDGTYGKPRQRSTGPRRRR